MHSWYRYCGLILHVANDRASRAICSLHEESQVRHSLFKDNPIEENLGCGVQRHVVKRTQSSKFRFRDGTSEVTGEAHLITVQIQQETV